jgi:uncharacterized repeat protein (TIGR03803 family)
MTNPRTPFAFSQVAQFSKLESLRARTALILTTLMLLVAAATTTATAQTYTDVYNFDGTDGWAPAWIGLLAQGRDGDLYGTTTFAGPDGVGNVFRITPGGTLKVLYTFTWNPGAQPDSGLTLGRDGNFYGTTYFGGSGCYLGCGTLYKITPKGRLTNLYNFSNSQESNYMFTPPVEGTDGNFYGVNADTAYKITSSGTFTLLASLPFIAYSPLLQGPKGNFYGTTAFGGSSNTCFSCGTIFEMNPNGALTVLYNFDGIQGQLPIGPLILGSDGNFYGTTSQDTTYGGGVAFKFTPQGTFTVLHDFPDPNYPNDGTNLYAGLIQATDGNFYGATAAGGTMGYGVIFQITSAGAYSILYNFDGTHGDSPLSTPIQHTNGKIYGLTYSGGTTNQGVVYSLDMGLAPFVNLVSPVGNVGKSIQILGQGLTGTTAVAFNGTAATFTVVSDTYLVAAVPVGATSGFVTVTTPGGKLTSNIKFRVAP